MMAITIMKITMQTIRAVARRPVDIMYSILVPKLCIPTLSVLSNLCVLWFSIAYKLMFSVGSKLYVSVRLELVSISAGGSEAYKVMVITSLTLPVIFPQTTVCTANVHSVPLNDMSVQVTLVWLVVVGQLPQFDARML